MHVLVIPAWYPLHEGDLNGVFFREQARALARAGLRVGVIAPQFRSLRDWRSTYAGPYGHEYNRDGEIPTLFQHGMFWFPRVPHLDVMRWIAAGRRLFKRYVEEHGKPDVIHAHCLALAGELALDIHERTGIPYCVTEHSSTYFRNLVHSWQLPSLRAVASKSYANFAVSESLAARLYEYLAVPGWEYLPNILDAIFAAPIEERADPGKVSRFCSVGRLHPVKRFDVLVRAFAQAVKKNPAITLEIGGDGPERVRLRQLARELCADNQIRFCGALDRQGVRSLMRDSDAFVLASDIETFGVVVIEALSQGLPVITTRCGGPESILRSADGLFVPCRDSGALASAMMGLVSGQHSFDSKKIRASCISRFGEVAVISQLKGHYERICQTENRSASRVEYR